MNPRRSILRPFWTMLLISGVVLMGATAAQAEFRLRWAHYLSDGPFLEIEKQFARNLEQRTKGQVKIEITFAGGLGKDAELLTLVGRGAVDMASTAPGFNPDRLRYWRAFQLPFVFTTTEQAISVLLKLIEEFPVFHEEMDRLGAVWLFQQPVGEYYLSGASDCATTDKLRGKKIRSFGADLPKAYNAIGAVPVTVTSTDIYESLKLGTLDYSFLNVASIRQYRLWEVAKYNCGPVLAIGGHNIIISKRTFNRLPREIQDAFLDEAKKTQKAYVAWVRNALNGAIQSIKEHGGVFTEFPAAELKKWMAASPDSLDAWEKATAAATKDSETPAKIVSRWKQLLSQ